MPRIARVVVPEVPHHITQRGNRRGTIFFSDDDYALYRDTLASLCRKHGVACWAYCLMPNHVHLVLVPADATGLSRAVAETHRRYSAVINARLRVTGPLFQARFSSAPMDEAHLLAAARYVSMNPVRARLVEWAEVWRWSSVRAHLAGRDDALVTVAPILERVDGRFCDLVDADLATAQAGPIRAAETTGRPLGGPAFLERVAALTGRDLGAKRRGP